MITMNQDQVMQDELRTWTISDSKSAGREKAKELLDEGFARLSGRVLVAMPKLGRKDGKPIHDSAATNLENYWKAFFKSTGAEIEASTAKLACDGKGGF